MSDFSRSLILFNFYGPGVWIGMVFCANAHTSPVIWSKTSSDANEPFEMTFYFHIHVLNSLKFSRCGRTEWPIIETINTSHRECFAEKCKLTPVTTEKYIHRNKQHWPSIYENTHWNSWAFKMFSIWSSFSARIASRKKRWQMKLKGMDTRTKK